jgi:hypothetical protein
MHMPLLRKVLIKKVICQLLSVQLADIMPDRIMPTHNLQENRRVHRELSISTDNRVILKMTGVMTRQALTYAMFPQDVLNNLKRKT